MGEEREEIIIKNEATKVEVKVQDNDSVIPTAIGKGKVIDFNTVGEGDYSQ